MSKVPVRIVFCDDWEALYLNDTLVYENHSITAKQVLYFLSQHGLIGLWASHTLDDDYAAENGFPKQFADIPAEELHD